jgi:hypothetical protein
MRVLSLLPWKQQQPLCFRNKATAIDRLEREQIGELGGSPVAPMHEYGVAEYQFEVSTQRCALSPLPL